MADDDRPRFSGRVPASGAPLTPRTLALRPNPQSLTQGDDNRTSSDMLAEAVYGFLQRHPGLGVPEEGQRNLAEFARNVNQLTPWGSGESAVNSAKAGDLPGTVSGIFGATPLVGVAGGIVARAGKTAAKDAAESVASSIAKRAVLTGGEDAVASAAPTAAETTAPVITGQVSAGGVTPAPPPIVAYHGSPYSFDRFDSSKIGTGEGAQAYGHGLYFADSEDVAKSYRDSLTAGKWQYAGKPAEETWDASALDYLDKRVVNEKGMPAAIDDAVSRLKDQSSFYNQAYAGGSTAPNLYDNAIARLQRLDPSQIKPAGSMYQVGINADPNSFLDWDKPLAQQSPAVQQALSGIVSPQDAAAYHFGYAPEEFASLPADRQTQLIAQTPPTARDSLLPQTGADIVKRFGGGAESADALNKMGISGVKYLDQGSRVDPAQMTAMKTALERAQARGDTAVASNLQQNIDRANNGSRNYVLFDDSLASILKKYGLAGLGTAGGAAALTAGGQSSMSPVSPAEAAEPPQPVGLSPGFDDWWQQLQNQRFSGF